MRGTSTLRCIRFSRAFTYQVAFSSRTCGRVDVYTNTHTWAPGTAVTNVIRAPRRGAQFTLPGGGRTRLSLWMNIKNTFTTLVARGGMYLCAGQNKAQQLTCMCISQCILLSFRFSSGQRNSELAPTLSLALFPTSYTPFSRGLRGDARKMNNSRAHD